MTFTCTHCHKPLEIGDQFLDPAGSPVCGECHARPPAGTTVDTATLTAGRHGTMGQALTAAKRLGFPLDIGVTCTHALDPDTRQRVARLDLVTDAPAGNGWCENTFAAWVLVP